MPFVLETSFHGSPIGRQNLLNSSKSVRSVGKLSSRFSFVGTGTSMQRRRDPGFSKAISILVKGGVENQDHSIARKLYNSNSVGIWSKNKIMRV